MAHGGRPGAPICLSSCSPLSPLPLIVANSYGGEMVFRVYLFALPFVAFFAAASLFPDAGSRRDPGASRWR